METVSLQRMNVKIVGTSYFCRAPGIMKYKYFKVK